MLKLLLRNWHRYVMCAVLSIIFWAWIFTLLFSAPANKKVVLYADLPGIDANALSLALEEDLPDGIRLVETGVFDGMFIDTSDVLKGDLYVIPESKAEAYLASFAEIDRADFPGETYYESDGKAYGILVYDEAGNLRIGGERVYYIQNERFYLFFNRDSGHLGDRNGSPDDAAITIAQQFLKLR